MRVKIVACLLGGESFVIACYILPFWIGLADFDSFRLFHLEHTVLRWCLAFIHIEAKILVGTHSFYHINPFKIVMSGFLLKDLTKSGSVHELAFGLPIMRWFTLVKLWYYNVNYVSRQFCWEHSIPRKKSSNVIQVSIFFKSCGYLFV